MDGIDPREVKFMKMCESWWWRTCIDWSRVFGLDWILRKGT
jgi:hypothetical protein